MRRCHELAAKTGRRLEEFQTAWEQLRRQVVICAAEQVLTRETETLRARHPNDLPYAFLLENLSADAILSFDKDLRGAGFPTADVAVIADLRDFARHKSVEVTIAVDGVLGVGLCLKLLFEMGRVLVRARWGMLILLAVGAVGWLWHRVQISNSGTSVFTRAWQALKDLLSRVLGMFRRSKAQATVKWKRVMTTIGRRRRRSLRQFVYAVLAMARKPLDVPEIVQRVRSEGHRTRAKDLRPQVRRYLRLDARFAKMAKGWTIGTMFAANTSTTGDVVFS